MTSHNFLTSWRLRAGSVVFVVAAAAALSGCNSGREPGPSASVSASAQESITASATPTPSPTAKYKPADAKGPAQNVPIPVLPEVAKKETKEGLEAFARYWFSVLSYSYETGDLALLKSMTPASCVACQKSMKSIQDWHSEGRWLIGGTISTPAVNTTFTKDAAAKYQVAVQVLQEPLSYVRADGTVAHSESNGVNTGNLLIMSFGENSWVLHEVGRILG